ncbi:uncharacterized protein TRIADDRAFT_56165 [Trichoplax adhaerens]|uniref:Hydroxylysine kinase n=1 Tax=Trichoplax adhaerens TaxID=10228 RepID=B3RXD0_TRIAD|nr:hypothetical protein TRIADDRAFT_56165 [Trichoplax adhaerens]EDV24396.1 hypothetical protein TRIADDRAFT_56165 [Trichoplax adhaerens]|eukprot:XP_002112286.1 hypothetical protein TRIADDRAFT_56165 [Trichoplax adhaerens]
MADRSLSSSSLTRDRPPLLSKFQLQEILKEMVGKDVHVKEFRELPSYQDRNYYFRLDLDKTGSHIESPILPSSDYQDEIKTINPQYVLKILRSGESKKLALGRLDALLYLGKTGFECSRVIPLRNQEFYKMVAPPKQDGNNQEIQHETTEYIAYILSYIDGSMISTIKPTYDLFYRVGKLVGKIDSNWQGYHAEVLKGNNSIWSLRNFHELRSCIKYCKEEDWSFLETTFHTISKYFKENVKNLRQSTIHSDINQSNILVQHNQEKNDYDITAIIDYGDIDYDCLIFELGITIAYLLLVTEGNPVKPAAYLIAGYHSVLPINETEYKGLHTIIAARYFQSIVLANRQRAQDPDNDYIMSKYNRKWELLRFFTSTSQEEIYKIWDQISWNYNQKP